MPVIFVHGVATRQKPAYKAEVAQRDQLFQRLVMAPGDQIFDPDWGSQAAQPVKGGWVPRRGATETWSMGAPILPANAPSVATAVAQTHPDQAVDLAFGSLLAQDAKASGTQADPKMSPDEVEAFVQAVHYLEGTPDRTAFDDHATDAQFSQTLAGEIARANRPAPAAAGAPQAMGLGFSGVFQKIGGALKAATDPLRNIASDTLLSVIREPLSNKVALFLGDIFVYLRWREVDGANGTYNRILSPIIADLAKAMKDRRPGDKLVVVGHSLGGVILYDLLTDARCLAEIRRQAGADLQIDHLVTVGAQEGLFADLGLYATALTATTTLPKPACVTDWMNVFDYTDILSFKAEGFFSGVKDYEFDNVSGVLDAHTAYFQRPSFYARLRVRLGGAPAAP